MSYCPTCSSPTSDQWKVCATCGNPLTSFLNTEQLQSVPKKKFPWLWVGIGGGSALVIGVVAVAASIALSANQAPKEAVPTPTATQNAEEKPVSAAETIRTKLIAENICTSAWSKEDYEKSPSFGIGPAFWESGDVRVCQVDRTSKDKTRWVTVITGQALLQDFGSSWEVPYGSVSIQDKDWTIVVDAQTVNTSINDDPVVQAILAKLGGTYKLSSK